MVKYLLSFFLIFLFFVFFNSFLAFILPNYLFLLLFPLFLFLISFPFRDERLSLFNFFVGGLFLDFFSSRKFLFFAPIFLISFFVFNTLWKKYVRF